MSVTSDIAIGVGVALLVGLAGKQLFDIGGNISDGIQDGIDGIKNQAKKITDSAKDSAQGIGAGAYVGFTGNTRINPTGEKPVMPIGTLDTRYQGPVFRPTLIDRQVPKSLPRYVGPLAQPTYIARDDTSFKVGQGALGGLNFGLESLNLPNTKTLNRGVGSIRSFFGGLRG